MQRDLKLTTLKVKDGTGTPNEINVRIGEGNLVVTEHHAREYNLNRGLLDEVRDADQQPMDVRLDAFWDYITGESASGNPTLRDALLGEGEASAWVSSDSDVCRPYAVDLEFTFAPTPYTCGDKEVVTLPDFRIEEIQYDNDAGQLSCSGRCNAVAPTVVRSAQSSS